MKISRLEKVDPRDLWKGEATHFTPWLAEETNISLLADTIGIDLEVISEEKNVGPFKADILCKNTIDDTFVLIENQLERTDHTHLGQLLTYAAGLEAVAIVWIATKFTDEHRAALDWLNNITHEKIQFFGIELEVYKIGDSDPAPFFLMVSKPNDWTKAVRKSQDNSELSGTRTLNLEYWSLFKDYLESNGSSLKAHSPRPQPWFTFSIGKSHFYLEALASVMHGFTKVQLIITSDKAKSIFHSLKDQFEDQSYKEIDNNLVWVELEDSKRCTIYLKRDADITNKSDWNIQFQWLFENLEKMNKFFKPKIKKINIE